MIGADVMRKRKILVCGDVRGKFKCVRERLEKIHASKHGPFDAAFCVGQYFEDAGEASNYKEIPFPLPVYFISTTSDRCSTKPDHNLHFLGESGIANVCGLSVAFVSGPVSESHVKELGLKAKINDPSFRGIDFLLTCAWPFGVERMQTKGIVATPTASSAATASLACALKPRYHFAGTENLFFARVPYRNSMTGSLAQVHPTRFVGLGCVAASTSASAETSASSSSTTTGTTTIAAAKKKKAAKWLHALGLVPLASMVTDQVRTAELLKCPTNATACPFGTGAGNVASRVGKMTGSLKRNRPANAVESVAWSASRAAQIERELKHSSKSSRGSAGGGGAMQQFFFDETANKRRRMRGRDNRGGGAPKRRSCWFCLSTPNFETHLVAAVGTHTYLALPKGQLASGHILIVPIDHDVSSLSVAGPDVSNEIHKFLQALRVYFASTGKNIVAFEHNISRAGIMKHMHIQVVPIAASVDDAAVKGAFDSAGRDVGIRFTELDASSRLGISPRDPYFLAFLPSGKRLLHVAKPPSEQRARPTFRPSFGREVSCGLLGADRERINWKRCVLTKEQETKETAVFKAAFAKYAPRG